MPPDHYCIGSYHKVGRKGHRFNTRPPVTLTFPGLFRSIAGEHTTGTNTPALNSHPTHILECVMDKKVLTGAAVVWIAMVILGYLIHEVLLASTYMTESM